MRLLNTSTGALQDFTGRDIPPYIILSHVWEDEEVIFTDMMTPLSHIKSKRGYSKVATTCHIGASEGLRYVWIDTCCIDKSSSAELSESINSMFRWYRRAAKCYVYLSDLPPAHLGRSFEDDLKKCRWFTRGFTLQELIAPAQIDFFDREWNLRTTKRDSVELLFDITGVDVEILRHEKPLSSIPVAQRMSWAAHRHTTKIEDSAYCLFGIFDVNMPLLYGEEERAFLRLQEEILKNTMDLTILAWTTSDHGAGPDSKGKPSHDTPTYAGVFAQSPSCFQRSGRLGYLAKQMMNELSISNRGLKLDAGVMFRPIQGKQGHTCILPLCLDSSGKALGLLLKTCGPGLLARQNPQELAVVDMAFWSQTWRHEQRLLLRQLPETGIGLAPPETCGRDFILKRRQHILQVSLPAEMTINANLCWPAAMWDSEEQVFFLDEEADPDHGAAAVFMIQGSVAFPVEQKGKDNILDFQCIAYAVGWGRQQPKSTDSPAAELNFTLLDPSPREFASQLDVIHRRFDLLDFRNSAPLKTELIYHSIPQQSQAVYLILDLGVSVIVQCVAKRMPKDLDLCQNAFWRLDISWKVVPSIETPLKSHVNGQYHWL